MDDRWSPFIDTSRRVPAQLQSAFNGLETCLFLAHELTNYVVRRQISSDNVRR